MIKIRKNGLPFIIVKENDAISKIFAAKLKLVANYIDYPNYTKFDI